MAARGIKAIGDGDNLDGNKPHENMHDFGSGTCLAVDDLEPLVQRSL